MLKPRTINIDIDEGYEETGEFRSPKTEEPYIGSDGKVNIAAVSWSDSPRIILRRVWPQPAWLVEHYAGCWLYNTGSAWWVSRTEPVHFCGGVFVTANLARAVLAIALADIHLATFTSPPTNKVQIRK